MSTRNLNELVGLAPAKKSPASHPGYQRAGSYDCAHLKISPTLSRAVARHLAYHYTPILAAKGFARFLVVQGLPGEGKTDGVRITCSRFGVDMILSGPSEFAGETENAGSAAIGKVEDAIKAISARERRPFALVL